MSVATQANTGVSHSQPTTASPTLDSTKERAVEMVNKTILAFLSALDAVGLSFFAEVLEQVARSDRGETPPILEKFAEGMFGERIIVDQRGQMGAKRIGSLAIGIAVVGIVLNKMAALQIVTNSTGVIDINSIFQTAGAGLSLLVVGVIIAAAAVILNIWSGF